MTRRARRVLVVSPYPLSVPGGVQSQATGLVRWLRAAGHEAEVLAPARSLAVRWNGSVARVSGGPAGRAAVRSALAREWDVVHVHEPMAPSVSWWAAHEASRRGLGLVVTFHADARGGPLTAAWRGRAAGVLDGAVRTSVSQTARAAAVRLWRRDSLVVGNGLDVGEFDGDEFDVGGRDAPPDRPGPWRVTFLGRGGEPRKGLGVLLDALATVAAAMRARGRDWELVVAGPGVRVPGPLPAGVRLRRIGGRRGVDDATRARLLRATDVFVAPHRGGESFGLVLVEAMAAGAALVASDLPAFRRVATDADGPLARFVPPGRAPALAAALVEALDECAGGPAVASPARRRARAVDFDWRRLGPQWEAVHRVAVEGGSLPSPSAAHYAAEPHAPLHEED